jgi:hypothetical protein
MHFAYRNNIVIGEKCSDPAINAKGQSLFGWVVVFRIWSETLFNHNASAMEVRQIAVKQSARATILQVAGH